MTNLIPIPGFAHMKVLGQTDPIAYLRTTTDTSGQPGSEGPHLQLRSRVLVLVAAALDTASGKRAISHLRTEQYHSSIRLHLQAWLKTHGAHRHDAQVHSLHVQASGEFHGSVSFGHHTHAFTGSYRQQRLESFRLL